MTLLDAQDLQGSNEVGQETWQLFEQSFDVNLGDYHDLVGVSILELSQRVDALAKYPVEDACLSLVAFNRLRHAFQSVVETQRSSIRTATRIDDLLPWRRRHKQLAPLQSELGSKLPRLNPPSWLLVLCLILPINPLIDARICLNLRLGVGIIAMCSIVLALLALRAAMLYPARTIPATIETVGDLAKAVIALNYKTFAGTHGSSRECDVLPALRFLIAMQTCIGIDEALPETLIPSGLNIY